MVAFDYTLSQDRFDRAYEYHKAGDNRNGNKQQGIHEDLHEEAKGRRKTG